MSKISEKALSPWPEGSFEQQSSLSQTVLQLVKDNQRWPRCCYSHRMQKQHAMAARAARLQPHSNLWRACYIKCATHRAFVRACMPRNFATELWVALQIIEPASCAYARHYDHHMM